MEFVKREAMQFKAKREQPTYSSSLAAATSSEPVKNNGLVGSDEVILRLVEILTGPSNQRLVIPIAGMGGLGKTSLAETVFERSYVKHHFDVRLWATISQQYSAENIIIQLLSKSITGGDVSELGEELHKKLYGRRYLIVLDDMWSVEAWDEIRRFLPENGNGSSVVVTTRLSDLAVHLNSTPFKLNFLDKDRSWELFCGKTFGEEDCPGELEEIGKKIVKRSGGLPLSIVVMGGHLRRSSRAIEYWEKVAGYMNPISSIGEEEQCLEILGLSYQHLPAYLKPCFLYLGIFKEDEEIFTSKLLECWIAEGFLKPKRGLSLEEAGEDYLKDLIDRNLILVVRSSSWNGKVEWCNIHDSVREVCLKLCEKEKFLCLAEDTTQTTSSRERRIVILDGEKLNSDTIGAIKSAQLLRTLVFRGGNSLLNELLVDCSLLRVLSVVEKSETDDTCLSLAHFQQVNLRALVFDRYGPQFSESTYSIIDSSIWACWNLQTLRMNMKTSSYGPITLPYEIWEMPQLRHLLVSKIILPDDPATGEGSKQKECIVLQNLYTLEGVANVRLTEEVCKRMPNLKELSVTYHHFSGDYCLHNLGRFNKLKSLDIAFDDDSKWYDVVLSLTFPTSLEKLHLNDCHIKWKDLTMLISSLPHLGSLRLSHVRGSEWNLHEEEFCCLKNLEIWKCSQLKFWNANSSNFPCLESLAFVKIPKLGEIPLDIGEIPTLRLIRLGSCGAAAAVSAVRMAMEQETNYGNHELQLQIRFLGMMKEECLTTSSLHLYYDGKKIKTS